MGAVGMTVTFNVSALDIISDGGVDIVVDLHLWVTSPSLFVVLHSLSSSTEISGIVDDIVNAIDDELTAKAAIEKARGGDDRGGDDRRGDEVWDTVGASSSAVTSNQEPSSPFVVTVNAIQMSCSNYYHWMTQCLPRVLMALDTLLGDSSPLTGRGKINLDNFHGGSSELEVVVYLPAYRYVTAEGSSLPTAEPPAFVTETLQMLHFENNSRHVLSSTACDFLSEALPPHLCRASSKLPAVVITLRFEIFNALAVSRAAKVVIVPDWRFSPLPLVESGAAIGAGGGGGDSKDSSDAKVATKIGVQSRSVTVSEVTAVLDLLTLSNRSAICSHSGVQQCLAGEAGRAGSAPTAAETVSSPCCQLLSMVQNRPGLEFAIPPSLAAHLQSSLTATPTSPVGGATNERAGQASGKVPTDCLSGVDAHPFEYIVLISRAEKNRYARSRHLLEEKAIISALLGITNEPPESHGNDQPRLQVVVLQPDGRCKSHTMTESATHEEGHPLLCECVCEPPQGRVMGRLRRAREVLSRASVVVGVHGAGLTNILWARKGTPLVEISLHTARHRDYMHLAAALSLPYHSVMVNDSTRLSAFDEQVGVNIAELSSTVLRALVATRGVL
jgi:hypothetical protein